MFDNKKKLTDKEIQDYIDRKYKKTSGFEDLSTIVVGLTSLVGLYMETPSETVSTFFKIFIGVMLIATLVPSCSEITYMNVEEPEPIENYIGTGLYVDNIESYDKAHGLNLYRVSLWSDADEKAITITVTSEDIKKINFNDYL